MDARTVAPATSTAAPGLVPQQRQAPDASLPTRPTQPLPPAPAGTRVLVRLLTGHGFATVAQTAAGLAAGAAVLESTGSASGASLTVALGVLPYVALSGLAGVLADAVSRSVVLAWSCVARGVLTAALAAAVLGEVSAGWLALLAGLTAAAATPAYPALAAAVPQCVPDRDLERANAAATGVENLAWVAGPGLFGVLTMAGLGPGGVAAVAAVVSVLAAAVVAVRLPLPEARGEATSDGPWWVEAVAGLRLVARRRRLRSAMALAVVDNFLYGYLVVSLVLLAAEGGRGTAGAATASLTVGALVGVLAADRIARRLPTARLVRVALVAFALAAAGTGLAGAGGPALALVALAGAATLVAEITAVTLVQRHSDPEVTARVFGVYDQLNVGAIAVGSALAGPLSAAVGPGAALAVVAAAALAATVALGRGVTAP